MTCSKQSLQKNHLVKLMGITHVSLTEANQSVLFDDYQNNLFKKLVCLGGCLNAHGTETDTT